MKIKPNVKIVLDPMAVVPLVDVFFLLLIFFMFSSSLVFWPGITVETRVQLPQAQTTSMSAADKLVITITQSGHLFFNDKPLGTDFANLERELREVDQESRLAHTNELQDSEASEDSPYRPPLVILRADKSTSYEDIVVTASLAQSLGLAVLLVTDTPGVEHARSPLTRGPLE